MRPRFSSEIETRNCAITPREFFQRASTPSINFIRIRPIMTNGWDVLTDAIKIGVPSLLTGLVAFFIARSSRSHEFEKERRRRKQNCLERAVEDYDPFDAGDDFRVFRVAHP
jgi:pilus assembly protein TadC